jgi:UDP-N-acetylglucosamine--N-acetylmuramyl-(pentapeptide) pyrophosphoryl-undecaprenol N-acetylglucosamine transferase
LNRWTKVEARSFFAFQEQLPVLMVLGGSRGARSINQALVNALPELLKDLQVIHISGNLDWEMVEQFRGGLSTEQLSRYRPYPYLHDEIGAAMALADLVLTRAGASILGELPAFGLPAILVPYPYAWRYQRLNASYLVKRGAAVQLDESQLAGQIIPLVRELLGDKEKLATMSEAMRSLAKPEAATRIATILMNLASPSLRADQNDVSIASG